MTPTTSNIIPFPLTPIPPVIPGLPTLRSLNPQLFTLTGGGQSGEEDHAAHVAAVVRAAIVFARRKGVRLDSLPQQLRSWLLDLCEAGDPTCRMVRDWLTGNARYCSDHIGEDA